MNCQPPKIASVIKNFPGEFSDNCWLLYYNTEPTENDKKSIITSGYYIVSCNAAVAI